MTLSVGDLVAKVRKNADGSYSLITDEFHRVFEVIAINGHVYMPDGSVHVENVLKVME